MRNFIKNHTPEWWDGWCWFHVAMIVWCLTWAAVYWGEMSAGFQIGMAFLWVLGLINRAGVWYLREIIKLDSEIMDTKNQIIMAQQEHINYLKGQR